MTSSDLTKQIYSILDRYGYEELSITLDDMLDAYREYSLEKEKVDNVYNLLQDLKNLFRNAKIR